MSRSRSIAFPVAIGLFGLGLLAIIAVFVLFATGTGELSLWLNLATLLAPLGLITGIIGAIALSSRA